MCRFFQLLLRSLGLATLLACSVQAQDVPYSFERPGGFTGDPLEQPRDVTGRSVKTPRVRALHDPEGSIPGSAGWMFKNDPWLAYAWGRELALREFSADEGAFGESGRLGGVTLNDQATPIMSRGHVNSCAICHNVPWQDMGAGVNISKNASSGRNTPHLFGAGVVEMIGGEIRHQLLSQADLNGDGWIAEGEAEQAGSATVEPVPGQKLNFGNFDDRDRDGRPDLNTVVYVWYVDSQGERISWARSLLEEGVAGYNFSVQVFGHGQSDRIGHGGLGDSLRSVAAKALDMHAGLQAFDPTCNKETSAGLTQVSLAGAQQFFTGFSRDLGQIVEDGISHDDPDRDGVKHEISEGDLDLLEWFLLNHPTPNEERGAFFEAGMELAEKADCFTCHTPNWHLPTDRRFFEFENDRLVRRGPGPNTIKGLYSDFRHHDMGQEFQEVQFDGTVRTKFRTPPLWGVGTSGPYGHDGASLTLDEVIRRHGGEALGSRRKYEAFSSEEREKLQAFLRSLTLRSTNRPMDIDGDGCVSENFMVSGVDTGREKFNPEWLFKNPGQVEGLTDSVRSWALTNLRKAYGLDLPGLLDRDRDGFPDILQTGKTRL